MITDLLLFIGTTELLLIGGMALLLFGGKKLPEMMRGLGQGVKEFKKGVNDVETSINGNGDEHGKHDGAEDGMKKDGGEGDNDANEEKTGRQ